MKKITNIVLLFCFLFPLLGTYSFLSYQKKMLRKEIKKQLIAGIDEKELVFFVFTIQETQQTLRWKHAKEFEYKGEMYDIVRKEERSDSVFYWCWWDHKETHLNQQLDQLTSVFTGKESPYQEKKERTMVFFKSLYCQSLTDSDYSVYPMHSIEYNLYVCTVLFFDASPPFLPPETV